MFLQFAFCFANLRSALKILPTKNKIENNTKVRKGVNVFSWIFSDFLAVWLQLIFFSKVGKTEIVAVCTLLSLSILCLLREVMRSGYILLLTASIYRKLKTEQIRVLYCDLQASFSMCTKEPKILFAFPIYWQFKVYCTSETQKVLHAWGSLCMLIYWWTSSAANSTPICRN
jgi:hypothetical protein